MNIQCPHCHNPIEVVETPLPREVVCAVCGSSINLDPGGTITMAAVTGRRRVGRYELLEVVGVGAHGTVFKARDSQLERIVAVKIPRVSALPSQDDIDRFLRESRSTAQLKHPSIVSLYDAGQEDETCYLVSEFVQGATLADRLTSGWLTVRQAAELAAAIADALHYAHQQGVVHRDIKPSNIMLDLEDRPHLMDFGLAKREAGEITMTIDGQVLGTPAYMSPEQARGEAHCVDARSDIYSLGVILYELLTGELPFRGNTRMLLVQVLRDEPRSPRRLNDRIPKDLETVCLKAMAKEPSRRYPSAADFAEDLRRWLRQEPVHARPVGAAAKAWRWCRRNPTVAGLSATVAVLLVATAVVASLAALHLGRLADSERMLRADAEASRTTTVQSLVRAEEARRQAEEARNEAVTARDQEAAERTRAEHLAKSNRLGLYAARVNLAQQAWEAADVAHAIGLLQSQIPGRDEEDLRGFEWYYLWQLCHSERLTIRVDSTPVRGVAVSPDGQWLAAAAGNVVRLYDLTSGQPRASLHMDKDVRAVAFSPDSQLLAAGGGAIGAGGRVKFWDVASKLERATLPEFDEPVLAVAFSPDGKTLATGTTSLAQGWGNPLTRLIWAQSGSKSGQVKLWDSQAAEVIRTCDGPTSGILSLAFSPDGNTLAAGGWDASVRLWDTATGHVRNTHEALSSYVWSVAFAPDGELYSAGGKWDGHPELHTWSTTDDKTTLPSGHAAGITSLAFSPDGKTLATASWDRTVKLHRLPSGEELATFKGHTSYVASVAFSADGEYLVTGSWDGTVKLWYTNDPLDQTTLTGWEVGGYCVSFHPGGALLATASSDSVSVWDLARGEIEVSLPSHSQTVVAFAPDGKTLATSGIDRLVRIYDTSNWRQLRTLAGHTGTIWSLAYSPDARQLATGSQDTTAKLWDVATGKELTSLDGGLEGTVRSVAFSPDGKSLAAAVHIGRREGKSRVKIWDLNSQEEIIALDAHQHNIECVAFSPDGKTLATSSHDATAILWDATGWQPRATLKGHTEPIYHLTFSPDGKTVATAGWDGVIGLWNTATGQRMATLHGHSGTVWNVAFSPDGKMLSSASSYQMASQSGYRRIHGVKLWHAATEGEVQTQNRFLAASEKPWKVILPGDGAVLQTVAFLPGNLIATGDAAGMLVIWDAESRQLRNRTSAHAAEISCLEVSPDGSTVATASRDGTVKLWEMPAVRERTILRGHSGRVDAVAFSPDGTTLATGGVNDHTTILWDVSSGEKQGELTSRDTVSCLSFSPDGQLLATGSWGLSRVQLWDLGNRQVVHTLPGHQWGITCVAFSPDGKTIAAGGGFGDPTIRLWDVASGEERGTLVGHADETTALAFSRDGKWLLSAGLDQVVKLWELPACEERRTLFGHPYRIRDLAISAEDGSLATASIDGAVRVESWSTAKQQAVNPPKLAIHRVPPQRQFADLQALYSQRQWQELAQAAEQAAQVMKSDKTVYQYLGEACFQLEDHARAVNAFERHVELCPNCPYALERLVSCRTALGDHAGVAQTMERILQRDPDRADANNNLAWLYAAGPQQVRNPQRALELARKALELAPDDPRYLNTLGVAYYRAEKYVAAADALLQAGSLNPEGATAFDLFFVAMSYQQLGEHEKAKEYYDQANEWWLQRTNLPAKWQEELREFRSEAARVLDLPPAENEK